MKIMLSGGGTAGHITPLLAVAQEILQAEPSAIIEFIGQKGDTNTDIVKNSNVVSRCRFVHAGKFRRFHSLSLWQNITNFKVNLLNLRDLFLVVLGFIDSIFELIKSRPDVIFFKGGFVVVPVGLAARLLRVPYITHDSDPLSGLANRIISKGAVKNAVVNEGVKSYPIRKTIVSGIPLDSEYEKRRGAQQSEYKKRLKLPEKCQLILVFTGTQGAKVIDDALEKILPDLLKQHKGLHVNYVFGRLNEASLENRYRNLNSELSSRLHKMKFIDNAYDHIAAADIVIGRAGATSMAEFATIGRACIIIPAEQLTGGHQLMNAQIYSDMNSIEVVREADLENSLAVQINHLLNSEADRRILESNIRRLAPHNAAKILSEEIISTVKTRAG